MSTEPRYILCQQCTHALPVPEDESDIECERCGHQHTYRRPKSAEKTLAYSLTALVFYVPANLLPFMTIELYGNRNSSTIWSGIVTLAEGGSWAIAFVVFLASILVPLLKLLILFYLSLTVHHRENARQKTRLYHAVEAIGRWSMLDIFLLAVLVAIMKLGPWTAVEPGLGSLMFILVVVFTMMASAAFDPRLLWEKEHGEINLEKNQ